MHLLFSFNKTLLRSPPTRGLGLSTASDGGTTLPTSPTRHSHPRSHADGHACYPRASATKNGTQGTARGQAAVGFPSTGCISRSGPARRKVLFVMSPTCCFPNRLHDSQFEQQRWIFYHFQEVTLSPAPHTADSLQGPLRAPRPTRPKGVRCSHLHALDRSDVGSVPGERVYNTKFNLRPEEKLQHCHALALTAASETHTEGPAAALARPTEGGRQWAWRANSTDTGHGEAWL